MPDKGKLEADSIRARVLARWEGEGGALDRATQAGDTLDEMELRILTRLGAALLGEWTNLPTDLQRAIFTRASMPRGSGDEAHIKTEIARFLHDHKDG
jgi:alkylhydroperoxidase family enzyme